MRLFACDEIDSLIGHTSCMPIIVWNKQFPVVKFVATLLNRPLNFKPLIISQTAAHRVLYAATQHISYALGRNKLRLLSDVQSTDSFTAVKPRRCR
ncbi:uncharacterized protein BCR38DRAFT_91987 [Pseudomassariella vexata]|uniref:Uncharacterized protein n=1 Tax=Pseudomassariella vexata TaxID=1141098 RepID=A0A1Y2EDW5_9PEZI|nr:uncharacterized protein BCR38DRAFT_91987 [Pseudomassariella vexata]ORY69762.1 hypothetical protein BCR38DRAFT_91987 [Pseudomassariella vexata]